jgi:hypothetical protein
MNPAPSGSRRSNRHSIRRDNYFMRSMKLAISFFIGATIVLVFAGPFHGYVRGLLSDEDIRHNNHHLLVDSLHDEMFGNTIFNNKMRVLGCFPRMSPCQEKLFMLERESDILPSDLVANISQIVEKKHEDAVKAVRRNGSPLMKFSWPTLSALKGCMDASIAAGLCKQYVRRLFKEIPEERILDVAQKMDAISRNRDADWCRISEYFHAVHRSRTKNSR